MRWHLTIMAICIIAARLNCAAAIEERESISDLKSLITSFDDPGMNSLDLAFYLATHNYDATPFDGYVLINIDGKVMRLVPNGDRPGLCDIIS
jgi:hypothetical protein